MPGEEASDSGLAAEKETARVMTAALLIILLTVWTI